MKNCCSNCRCCGSAQMVQQQLKLMVPFSGLLHVLLASYTKHQTNARASTNKRFAGWPENTEFDAIHVRVYTQINYIYIYICICKMFRQSVGLCLSLSDYKMTVRLHLFLKPRLTQGLFDRCACTSQDEYCTTDLCQSVDKLKKKKTNKKEDSGKEETVLVYRCQCLWCTICQLLNLKELTPLLNCRRVLKAVSCHHRSFSFVPPSAVPTFAPPAISRKRSLNFFASARVRNPSRCFVKSSAVLFFVSTRLTDTRFSRIHCCIAKHRISTCLSPPGPLRCRMCLAESESISRRTETSQ